MKFKIDRQVCKKFPELVVAVVLVEGFDNTKKQAESVEFLQEQEAALRQGLKLEQLWQLEQVKMYKQAFEKFGIDPDKFLASHIALSKRVLEGGKLPDINPLVNLYNGLSIKYLSPFGGEDLDSLYGDFSLVVAKGDEKWTPLGGGKPKICQKDELVWQDDIEVLTRALNWRQGDRTKLVEESTNGYFIMEGFEGESKAIITKAAEELSQMAVDWFGGEAETIWLTKDSREVEIDYKTKDKKAFKKKVAVKAKKRVKKQKKIVKEQALIGLGLEIKQDIEKVVKNMGLGEVKFVVDHPENMDHGDFACNIALVAWATKSSELRRSSELSNPKELAKKIVKQLNESNLKKKLSEICIAGPGFINISIQKDILGRRVDQLLKGKVESQYKGKKIAVEYTDPNPFKELHIGHLYSNFIGESVSKIFEANGAVVWRGDFYGDVGMHVAKSVWGMLKLMKKEKVSLANLKKQSIKERQAFMGKGYALGSNEYEDSDGVREEVKDLNYLVYIAGQEALKKSKNWKPIVDYWQYVKGQESKLKEIQPVYEAGLNWSLEYFETFYKRLETKFDGYYPESWVGELGMKVVEKGLKMGVLEKSKGAVVYKGEQDGLHTRVFVNKLGLPTYEAKDLGLVKAKYEDFKFDLSINVFGKEIDEYFKVVKK